MDNFRGCKKRINSNEKYMRFKTSKFNVITKDENCGIDEMLHLMKEKLELI